MAKKNPWMKFYPADWRGDQALRMVSLAARGLWMECLAIMHEAKPYGYLVVNGRPVGVDALARMVGASSDEVRIFMSELQEFGVCDVTGEGVTFSRRMVRDQERANKARMNGAKGGNPSLRKETGKLKSVNPPVKGLDKPHIPEARGQNNTTRKRERDYSDRFEGFWAGYPRKTGTSKRKASDSFERLSESEQAAALVALPAFCQAEADTEERFIPHAATWLNQRRFETYEPEPDRADRTAEQWRSELELWRDHGEAEPNLWRRRVGGPNPGEPGCKAPAKLQREFGFDPKPAEAGRACA
jgi:hypothetical protein